MVRSGGESTSRSQGISSPTNERDFVFQVKFYLYLAFIRWHRTVGGQSELVVVYTTRMSEAAIPLCLSFYAYLAIFILSLKKNIKNLSTFPQVLMRHSIRLDKDGWDVAPEALWPDKKTRPYDPPISDFELPATAAKGLRQYRIKAIVSSPFRRCLQTAGIVARTLGITTVHIDDRLGEWYREIERCCRGAGISAAPAPNLPQKEVDSALGDKVAMGDWNRVVLGSADNAGLVVCLSQ